MLRQNLPSAGSATGGRGRPDKTPLEVLSTILYDVLMSDVMERINLNVPADVRARLRQLATRAGRTEAEVARALLVGALERARREDFYRQVADAQSRDLRDRDLRILRAFERIDG
jgi:hypothetical protein